MNAVRILIVEDEFITQRHIKRALNKLNYNAIETAMSVEEAIKILDRTKIDLVLLDINLEKEKDGICIANYINDKLQIPFIYLTAYGTKEIIKKAIPTKPISYLTKPFEQADLMAAMELAVYSLNTTTGVEKYSNGFIIVKNDNYHEKVDLDSVVFIESCKNYLRIHITDHTYSYRSTIKDILKILPENLFVQTHRSYIVATKKIKQLGKNSIKLGKVNEVPLSDRYREEVVKCFAH